MIFDTVTRSQVEIASIAEIGGLNPTFHPSNQSDTTGPVRPFATTS